MPAPSSCSQVAYWFQFSAPRRSGADGNAQLLRESKRRALRIPAGPPGGGLGRGRIGGVGAEGHDRDVHQEQDPERGDEDQSVHLATSLLITAQLGLNGYCES